MLYHNSTPAILSKTRLRIGLLSRSTHNEPVEIVGVGREVAYRTESREVVEVEEVEEDIAEVHQSCRTFTRTRGILTENGIALVMKTVLDFPMPAPKGVKGFGGRRRLVMA